MKLVPLSQLKFALVDDEDYDRVMQYKWSLFRHKSDGLYAIHTPSEGKSLLLHRFIMNAEDDQEIDHINRSGLDCRKSNLRFCTSSQNAANRSLFKNNTSGYKGVSMLRDKPRLRPWMAYICKDRKQIHLGAFETAEIAARVYDAAALELFGEFAYLNSPISDVKSA